MNNYEVTIKKLDYGYEVKVGCKTFAIEKIEGLLSDLKDYYTNPEKVYKKYKIKKQDFSYIAATATPLTPIATNWETVLR